MADEHTCHCGHSDVWHIGPDQDHWCRFGSCPCEKFVSSTVIQPKDGEA